MPHRRFTRAQTALGLAGLLAVLGVSATAYAGTSRGARSAAPSAKPHFTTAACKNLGGRIHPRVSNPIRRLAGGAKTLSGAGATFPAPIISLWTKTYEGKTGNQVAYQSIGSGGGVAQIIAKTVDFGQSDVPMTDEELARAKEPILHVPIVLGAVVPAYNLPDLGSGLRFTGDVLGRIFAGKITKWNDSALKRLNPGISLPNLPIAVAHRSDGSGTTGIWTDFLTKTSPVWVRTLGGKDRSVGKTVAWPVGIGGKGNEGVSAVIGQQKGALGYVELQYALSQHLAFGQVKNRSGVFAQPCVATITAAVKSGKFPADLRTSLTWLKGKNA